jgi:MFS family permease
MIEIKEQFIDRILELLAAGLLSVFGGTAAYIYKSMKEETGFKLSTFMMNAFLAFFIGNVVGGFIAKDASFRDGLLMLAGFSTHSILMLLELYGRKYVFKYISKATGVDIDVTEIEQSNSNQKIAEAELAIEKAKHELELLKEKQ